MNAHKRQSVHSINYEFQQEGTHVRKPSATPDALQTRPVRNKVYYSFVYDRYKNYFINI